MQHSSQIVNRRRTGRAQPESLVGPVPLFVALEIPGKPRCAFPFCGAEGWAFVGDMERAGWIRSIEGSHLVLTKPRFAIAGVK
jgi:hypothetical protein